MNKTELVGHEVTYLRPAQSGLARAVETVVWLLVVAAIGVAIYGFAITNAPIK